MSVPGECSWRLDCRGGWPRFVNRTAPEGEQFGHRGGEREAREYFDVEVLTHRVQFEKDVFAVVRQLHVDRAEDEPQVPQQRQQTAREIIREGVPGIGC